ncbi:MAG: UDP binding domain-containing protein [Gemmataceae bacterium]
MLPAKIRAHFGPDLKEKTIALWGLAFKPRTDDIREAPALTLIDALLAEDARLRVHDPEAIKNIRDIYGDSFIYCDRPTAPEGADALAIVTEWAEFRRPDFEAWRRLDARPSSSTAATSTSRKPSKGMASSTMPSAARDAGRLIVRAACVRPRGVPLRWRFRERSR